MARSTPLQIWQNLFRSNLAQAGRELTTPEERYALWAFLVLRATYELAPERPEVTMLRHVSGRETE